MNNDKTDWLKSLKEGDRVLAKRYGALDYVTVIAEIDGDKIYTEDNISFSLIDGNTSYGCYHHTHLTILTPELERAVLHDALSDGFPVDILNLNNESLDKILEIIKTPKNNM